MMMWAMFATLTSTVLTAPGPEGPLSGLFVDGGKGSPVVLIVPGSGPTDRDGNNALGITGASYRLLAEELASRHVSSVRIDKRGMFASKAAIGDANKVTIADYADDVHAWATVVRQRTGAGCIWVLGHSEGGLVALAAAQDRKDLCGVILVTAAGRRLGDILRSQLRANPANAPVLDDALGAIDSLEAGKTVDVSAMHPALQSLFAPAIQSFLIDSMAKDPARLAAALDLPMLIVAGERDVQISRADAEMLRSARPDAGFVVVPSMTHALKDAASDSPADNRKTFTDPSQPVSAGLVTAISTFVLNRTPAGR